MTVRVAPNGPAYIQANSHNSEVFRQINQSLLSNTQGVVNGGDMVVTGSGTIMQVTVAAGFGLVKGTLSQYQGTYHVYNDASVNLAVTASNATNPRWDLVCLTIRDAAYSGANNDALLQVITGTAAPSPSDPAVPANSIVLARLVIPANATNMGGSGGQGSITDLRPFIARDENMATFPTQTQAALVGPPTTGTWQPGDRFRDKWGAMWICITAGTPGTWIWGGGGQYRARIYAAALSVIGTSLDSVVIGFDTKDGDPTSMATAGSQNGATSGHMTCLVAGLYQITARVQGTAAATGESILSLYKNPTFSTNTMTAGLFRRGTRQANSASATPGLVIATQAMLAVNDTIYVGMYQASGSSMNTGAGTTDVYLEMALAGS
jgi:hypothetical protein